jgi:ribulose-5-phosphate 4-epimerase/fuculose-1-phosphate aldolase
MPTNSRGEQVAQLDTVSERTAAATQTITTPDALLHCEIRTIEEERRWRKERVAGALRLLAKFGMNDGAAGHITARDPEDPDCFWVNSALKNFATIRVSDLMLVDSTGRVRKGDGILNQAAFAIHSRIHRARPEVIAAAHAHSTYGKIWSTTGRLLDPLTQDACAFYGSHSVFAAYTGVVLDVEEGDRIADALGAGKAVILRNHGLLTVGTSVEEAAWLFVAMEQACHVQVMTEAIGTPLLIEPSMAALTESQVGSAIGSKAQFDMQWEALVADDASFLS